MQGVTTGYSTSVDWTNYASSEHDISYKQLEYVVSVLQTFPPKYFIFRVGLNHTVFIFDKLTNRHIWKVTVRKYERDNVKCKFTQVQYDQYPAHTLFGQEGISSIILPSDVIYEEID